MTEKAPLFGLLGFAWVQALWAVVVGAVAFMRGWAAVRVMAFPLALCDTRL